MSFEIDISGCDYECMIPEDHQHIVVYDTTPKDPLEVEVQRMRAAHRRQRLAHGEGTLMEQTLEAYIGAAMNQSLMSDFIFSDKPIKFKFWNDLDEQT